MSLFCCFNVTLINMKTKTNENKNTSKPKEVSKTKKTTTKSVKKPKPAPKNEEIKVDEKPQEELKKDMKSASSSALAEMSNRLMVMYGMYRDCIETANLLAARKGEC